jgi:hypothetical protein
MVAARPKPEDSRQASWASRILQQNQAFAAIAANEIDYAAAIAANEIDYAAAIAANEIRLCRRKRGAVKSLRRPCV